LHQVGDLFELSVKLRCQKVNLTNHHRSNRNVSIFTKIGCCLPAIQ